MSSVYDPNAVANKCQKKPAIEDRIKTVLLANDGACYKAMEAMLLGNYSGSTQYDKAYAIGVLLDYDSVENSDYYKPNQIAACMVEKNINRRLLWNHIQKVLTRIGFEFKGGVIIGTRLEHIPAPDDSGDIA